MFQNGATFCGQLQRDAVWTTRDVSRSPPHSEPLTVQNGRWTFNNPAGVEIQAGTLRPRGGGSSTRPVRRAGRIRRLEWVQRTLHVEPRAPILNGAGLYKLKHTAHRGTRQYITC
jgi:hypothetical protein